MKFEKGRSEFPTGAAPELESQKEMLPAVEVKNHVVWVNPDLDLPFDLKVGEPTKLGVFLSEPGRFSFLNFLAQKPKNLEAEVNHNRSILLGRVIFAEKEKSEGERQLFRDIDIKGSGYVEPVSDSDHPQRTIPSVGEIKLKKPAQDFFQRLRGLPPTNPEAIASYGILDLKDANQDYGFAEAFHEYGIRTHRVVAIIELDEIISDRKRLSIAKAKAKGLIDKSLTPVLEVRAFGTHARLMDITSGKNSKEKTELLLKDAQALVTQELGVEPSQFTKLEYAKWLSKVIGKNLALLHKHGYLHQYLGQVHNITLDGCLVDFDSMKYLGENSPESSDSFESEQNDTRITLEVFLTMIDYDANSDIFKEIVQEYKTSYEENKR